MAAGDPIFIKRVQSVTLSGPEKVALANWVENLWPSINKATVDTVDITRKRGSRPVAVRVAAREVRQVPAADYLDIEGTRADGGFLTVTGVDVTYYHLWRTTVSGQPLGTLKSWIDDVFTEEDVPASSIQEVIVERTVDNEIEAALLYEATTDPVTYYQFKLQGRVDKLTGIE